MRQMPQLEVDSVTIEATDGTPLAVYDTGGDHPVIVLANGLGGPFGAWRYQIDYLRSRYRFVSWDYRGLFGSGPPPSQNPDVRVPVHVDDMLRVIEARGVQNAAIMGWSMGVQVALEFYSRRPDFVDQLILLNGTFGRPLESLPVPGAPKLVPTVLNQLQRFRKTGNTLLRRATQWPETIAWMKRLGLASATIDEEFFRDVAREFGTIDVELYIRTLQSLSEHDASELLGDVDVPTLVIAGDRDSLTPKSVSVEMASRLPRGELLVVRGATHYTAVEYPELVNLRIDKFLTERSRDRI